MCDIGCTRLRLRDAPHAPPIAFFPTASLVDKTDMRHMFCGICYELLQFAFTK